MNHKTQPIIIFSIFALALPILALSSPPAIPLLVYGEVDIDSEPAPVDTEITAEIEGVEVGSATVTKQGFYLIQVPDGVENEGKTVIFKVNGISNDDNQCLCTHIGTIPSIVLDLAVIATRSCSVSNGQGSQTWDGDDWGNCIVESCDTGFHQENNSCVIDATGGGGGGGGGGGSSYTPPVVASTDTKGDINNDSKVDKYDFSMMMASWGKTGSNNSDLNNDGKVDKYDFALLMSNWGTK